MKGLQRFKLYDLVVIALMAALGIATKPLIVPLTHMLTGPLLIPGGAIAGGLYMFWIVLSASLVKHRGAALLTAFIQGLIVMVTGSFGSHGIASIVTYTLPGLMIDVVFLLLRRRIQTHLDFFIAGMIANITGTYLTNIIFFDLPLIPLLLTLFSALLSGGLGGLIGYIIYSKLNDLEKEPSDE